MPRTLLVALGLFSLFIVACSSLPAPYEPAPTAPLQQPPPPPVDSGPLEVTVVYPPSAGGSASAGERATVMAEPDFAIQSEDSTFIFGSAGRGDVDLTVNGHAVAVYPTGGWIAWVPLPDDTVARFEIVATTDDQSTTLEFLAPIARGYQPPDSAVWIDTTSFSPSGDGWLRPGEGVTLSLRAAPGADVRGLLSDGTVVHFRSASAPDGLARSGLSAGTDSGGGGGSQRRSMRYVTWWSGKLGPDPDLVLAPNFPTLPNDSAWMWVEAVIGADTARARWPLRLGLVDTRVPTVVVLNDDPNNSGETDGIVIGRPSPSGTYDWFFPNGTRAVVNGRWGSQVRLQLSRSTVAWVSRADISPLPPGTPPPGGTANSLRLSPRDESVVLRVPLQSRIPFRIDESGSDLQLTLYGVAADMDWIHYGETDSMARLVSFRQVAQDEVVVTVSLQETVWGYRASWDGTDLLLEIRRPPVIDAARPLAGRVIALDAGHPPLGARGPTGVWEPDVVLQVVRKAAQLLEQYDASVVMTRENQDPVALMERPATAEASGAELLVSVHANALPDGVNPFANNGTSVYYFQPRSAPLAQEVNRALVRQFGFRDLGFGRGNLALARPTWMPAILTEGLFMMLPDQEAILASENGQWRYARGIVEGIAAYLRGRALGTY
jgi:N-acetylmuramoyl-L-alanine amidase